MATSPGRSATQTKPAASTATASRNVMTRTIAPSIRSDCARRIGCVLTRGLERALTRLRFRDPALCRRAYRIGKLAEIGERGRDVGLDDVALDTRQHRRRIVAGRRIDWTDAHELAGIGLQPFEEPTLRRLRARKVDHRRQQVMQLPRQRRRAWD